MASNGRNNRSKRGYIKYKSYLFIEKDPVIDALRTAVSDSGMKYREIHEEATVSITTMRNWFGGVTRRPQFCTIAAVAQAVGKSNITLSKRGVRLSD